MLKRWPRLLLAAALSGLAFNSLAQAAAAPAAADDAQIRRGEYLAVAGDCAACHTVSGKPPFGGGFAVASPLGAIYSTNITPSKSAGIGNYTLQQFSDALRKGVRADGSHLYPAMPYTAYAKLTDSDVADLYAYFMHGVAPVDAATTPTQLPFPFNIRASMAVWNALFLDGKPFTPTDGKSQEWLRGAYLVQGLAHCSTCHTPRNALMAEDAGRALTGASLGTWYAPNVTDDKDHGIGKWTRAMLVQYLATGHTQGANAGGPMLEAVEKSFSRMTPEDLHAITAYLLPNAAEGTATPAPPSAGTPAPATPSPAAPRRVTPITADDTPGALTLMGEGGQLFMANCASCHNARGEGFRGLPPLAGNGALRLPTADNLSMAILEGLLPHKGQGMPGFADQLDDAQIAQLSNYVLAQIGHSDVRTTPQRVAELRAGGKPSSLLLAARVGMGVVVVLILALILWRARRRRRA
ncbi:cytochrome c [Achromobacter aloeverae]